jgi:hypothetical protein
MSRHLALVVLSTILITGCANLTSIDRHTHLPGRDEESKGIAIHLDAKQRVAFAKGFGAVCAEPSPDALSAFASSFGGGLAVPQYGSLSIAQALTESAASIGLRTQSITLMRDALYRICEAYYNRALNKVMVMQLLGRTQDLTLGILAIEQLTQPVVAQQAVLTGSSAAASSASVLVTAQLLAAARERERQANERLETAKTQLTKSAEALRLKNEELAGVPDTPENQARRTSLAAERDKLDAEKKRDEEAVKTAEKDAEDARRSVETLEKSHDSAQSSASASSSGGGAFSAPIVLKQPPSEVSIKEVAGAVKGIVETIILRDHTVDACLALYSDIASLRNRISRLSDSAEKRSEEDELTKLTAMCREIIAAKLQALDQQREKAKAPPSTPPPAAPSPPAQRR